LASIARTLRREGLEVLETDDAEKATHLLRENRVHVLVTDLVLRSMTGLELIQSAIDVAPATRTILMSAFATARDYETALELGAVRVLCKPFDADQLTYAVRQAMECEVGFHGSFHGLGLVDMLQMFHFSNKSVVISLEGGQRGRVFMERGQIIHAEHGPLAGERALISLLGLPAGSLRTASFHPPLQTTIDRLFDAVLLDSLRALDEDVGSGHLAIRSLPPSAPDGASTSALSLSDGSPESDGRSADIHPSIPRSLRPAPMLSRDLSELGARFATAMAGTNGRTDSLVAAAFRPRACSRLMLSGDDALLGALVEPAREVLASARRLADSAHGVLERISGRNAVFIVWNEAHDEAYVLLTSFRSNTETAWLRAMTQTLARRLLGEEA